MERIIFYHFKKVKILYLNVYNFSNLTILYLKYITHKFVQQFKWSRAVLYSYKKIKSGCS